MSFSHSGQVHHFGQGGQQDPYYGDPPVNLSQQGYYEYLKDRDNEAKSLQLVDGQWVRVPAEPIPEPERPQRGEDIGEASAPTYRAPHGSNTGNSSGENAGRYKVNCGIDFLTLHVYVTEIARPDPHDKVCPLGAAGTFDELVAWRERQVIKPQGTWAAVWGGTGDVKGGYHFYGNHCEAGLDFRCEGIRIGLVDPRNHDDNSKPIAQVIVGGRRLSRTGHLDVFRQLSVLLRGLGLKVDRLEIQRVDIRADVLNAPTREFLEWAHRGGATVSKFKRSDVKTYGAHDSLETVAWGKSNRIRLQMYDKLHGLREQCRRGQEREANETWLNLLARYDEVPTSLLRCEYQIGKDWLKEHYGTCESVAIVARLDRIATYLFTEQCRVLEAAVNRGSGNHSLNRQGGELHPVWASIVEELKEGHFADDVCSIAERVIKRKREKSKECLERDFTAVVTRAMALSMTPEEIERTCESAAGVANFVARLGVAATGGQREKMRDKAIRLQVEWASEDLLPLASREAWSHREVGGFDVVVYEKLLDGSVTTGEGVPF